MISYNVFEIEIKYLDKYISGLNEDYLKARKLERLSELRALNDRIISVYALKTKLSLNTRIQKPNMDTY